MWITARATAAKWLAASLAAANPFLLLPAATPGCESVGSGEGVCSSVPEGRRVCKMRTPLCSPGLPAWFCVRVGTVL